MESPLIAQLSPRLVKRVTILKITNMLSYLPFIAHVKLVSIMFSFFCFIIGIRQMLVCGSGENFYEL